ncbi:MAG: hypothetical protein E7107_00420 [Prevotella sp.]|nr:hypothetical protein [Prevotella sp.]
MKRISNLDLFPRAARTLLLMVAITLAPMAVGGAELSGSWSDEANRNTSWGSDYETATAFTVNSEADLAQLAYLVDNGSDFSGKTITLAKDLDLSAHEWVSIGCCDETNIYYYFKGIFDGGNYSISGMTINKPSVSALGLFGTIDNGAIIRNVILTSGSVTGYDSVGGIVGEIKNSDPACQIINCHVLPGVTISGSREVGGIAGYQYGTISGCSSGASANAEDSCGGLIGSLNKVSTSLANCFYYGPDKDYGYAIVGVNFQTSANVSHCFYAANAVRGVDKLNDSKDKAARVYSVTAGEGVTISRSGTAAATYYDGKLKFYGDDGCSFDGTEYATEGTTLTISTTATFQGYETAINVEGTGATLNEGTLTVGTADVTVSAVKGTPIDYTITYDLDGGTASNPSTYTIETETFTLSNPIKAGYTFTGWSGTGLEGEANMNVTIAKGSTDERSYTAHWTSATGDTNGDWNGHAATSFTTIDYGSKTLSIASEAEMALLSKDASTYADYIVTLTADINLKDYFWTPIAGFNGTFDGQGHTISGVMINNSSSDQGLFGVFGKSANVRNLVIANSYISGGNNTGAVVGATDGTSEDASLIENCHVMESVTIAGTEGANYGGIAGYSGGSIIACSSAAMMSAQGNNTAGIVGSGYKIDQCLYYGTILPSDRGGTVWAIADGSVGCTNYQTYDATSSSHKYVRVYDADPGIMGTVTTKYSNTGYKVYEKGVSYGGKFYTAVVALTEDGTTDLTAYAGNNIEVAFRRSFTKDVASTVCLPFAIDATQAAAAGKFYTFAGVDKTGSEWEVIMKEADTSVDPPVAGNEAASLAANTPYLFMPADTGPVLFYGEVPATVSAGVTSDTEGWTFHGTYEKRQWDDTHNTDEIGRIYGFAAQAATSTAESGSHNIEAGNFIRIAGGPNSYALPFRAYLKYEPALQNAPRRTASELPATMKVRLVSNIGGTTAVTELRNKELGKRNDGWFTLDGRKLDGKPSAKGVYINNGRKTVIK